MAVPKQAAGLQRARRCLAAPARSLMRPSRWLLALWLLAPVPTVLAQPRPPQTRSAGAAAPALSQRPPLTPADLTAYFNFVTSSQHLSPVEQTDLGTPVVNLIMGKPVAHGPAYTKLTGLARQAGFRSAEHLAAVSYSVGRAYPYAAGKISAAQRAEAKRGQAELQAALAQADPTTRAQMQKQMPMLAEPPASDIALVKPHLAKIEAALALSQRRMTKPAAGR